MVTFSPVIGSIGETLVMVSQGRSGLVESRVGCLVKVEVSLVVGAIGETLVMVSQGSTSSAGSFALLSISVSETAMAI